MWVQLLKEETFVEAFLRKCFEGSFSGNHLKEETFIWMQQFCQNKSTKFYPMKVSSFSLSQVWTYTVISKILTCMERNIPIMPSSCIKCLIEQFAVSIAIQCSYIIMFICMYVYITATNIFLITEGHQHMVIFILLDQPWLWCVIL